MVKAKGYSPKTVVVVFNPGAGHARRVKIQNTLEKHFTNHNLELIECSDEDLLPELLRPWIKRNVDLVIAAGGDGTISSVASSLLKSDIPLGILPLGTGNVLANELGIPTNSRQAAKLLAGDYDLRLLDAIAVGDRSFLLS